jgi:uncharacterized SAM-binding protein YcdF (DUF218 family)
MFGQRKHRFSVNPIQLAPLFFPVSLCLELLLLGLVLVWFTRRQKTGKVVLLIGFLFLALLSFDAASDKLLQPLEYKYPPVLSSDDISGIKWVVVLGGGHISDPRLPVTSQRPSPGMFFPGAQALLKAEIAFHEYLGMAWAKIRVQM